MPLPLPVVDVYDHLHHVHGHVIRIGSQKALIQGRPSSPFDPSPADAKTPPSLSLLSPSAFARARHYDEHDAAARSAEAIELPSLHLTPAARIRPLVGAAGVPVELADHAQYNNLSSISTSSASSASTSRSLSPSLRQAGQSRPGSASEDAVISPAPMSPDSARYEHQIHIPQSARAADDDHDGKCMKADLETRPLRISDHSESDNTAPLETDNLLRSGSPLGAAPFPLPTTSRTPASVFPMAFGVTEMGVHVLAVAVVSLLVTLSIWLTLSNVMM